MRHQAKALLGARSVLLLLLAAFFVMLGGWRTVAQKPDQTPWPELKGYEAMKIPADNPMSAAKVELGHQLYYDTRLSGDGTRACYSCHLKEHGLTDGKPTAIGAYGAKLPRASPTLWNIGYHTEFYWDGRSSSLEGQAKAAWAGGNMGATGKDGKPSTGDICKKLDQIAGYRSQFQAVFGAGCTPDNVAKALSAFERTIVANQSAWIRFREGNTNALSGAARRGYDLFKGKARCTNCHDGLLTTDLQYHNVGAGINEPNPDLGRYNFTKKDADKGAFKTPTLLDISKSAPYFHNGSVATLEEAVNLMLAGGTENPNLDTKNLRPAVKLTNREKADLLAFLRSLNVEYKIAEPKLPQ